jgi:hypothetical protein
VAYQRAQIDRMRHFPFPFVDEAGQDPEFKAFRDRLERDVKEGDLQALSAAMAPALRARWPGWLDTIAHHTARVLPLGGAFTTTRGAVPGRREFCAPYVYGAFPNELPLAIEGEADPWAIIGARVPVRTQPRPSARVLTYLSWELVKADGWLNVPGPSQWAEVDLLDGRRGYVQEGQIRQTTDFHVCFAKIDGRWLMTAFARGRYPARGL